MFQFKWYIKYFQTRVRFASVFLFKPTILIFTDVNYHSSSGHSCPALRGTYKVHSYLTHIVIYFYFVYSTQRNCEHFFLRQLWKQTLILSLIIMQKLQTFFFECKSMSFICRWRSWRTWRGKRIFCGWDCML